MSAHLGLVLHVNESNGNLFNFVNNPANEVSCHFEVYKDGSAEQYLDGATDSWCQRAGNMTYLSMETEGYVGEPLTDAQLDTCAAILAWVHTEYGVPLQTCEVPGERGLGWHGMGAAHGVDWGHPACPGDIRRGQRAEIVARAQLIINPPEDEMNDADWSKLRDIVHEEVSKAAAHLDERNFVVTANGLSALVTHREHGQFTHDTVPDVVTS